MNLLVPCFLLMSKTAAELMNLNQQFIPRKYPPFGTYMRRRHHALLVLSLFCQLSPNNTCLSFQTQRSQSPNPTKISITHHQLTNSAGSSSCKGKGTSTVDLLQLSSHLQRIEQQRNYTGDVKQEYNELYFPGS